MLPLGPGAEPFSLPPGCCCCWPASLLVLGVQSWVLRIGHGATLPPRHPISANYTSGDPVSKRVTFSGSGG